MSENMIWLFIFLTAYWAYCGFFGIRGLRRNHTAEDVFLASRDLRTWVYAMAATVASVAGLVIVMQPALVYRDGFQAANISGIAIGMPIAGILLMKRQWMVSKLYGTTTQGEMLARYFGNEGARLVSVGIAIMFAVPFSAALLGATGYVASELSGGAIDRTTAMWVLSMVVLFYVATGGLRAVANIGVVQFVLFVATILFCGSVAISYFDGFDDFNLALNLASSAEFNLWGTTKGAGGGDYNGYFAVPGVIQFTGGLGAEAPNGGPWTSVMTLSYMFALMGVLSSPAFSMLGNANRSARGFGVHNVWLTGVVVGILLVFFVNVLGSATHLLGANPNLNASGLNTSNVLSEIDNGNQAHVLLSYLIYFSETMPWVVGFFGICIIAAIHATVAIFLSTTSTVLVRDIYKNYVAEDASDYKQILAGRIFSAVLMVLSLLMATYLMDAAYVLGGLALSCSVQLWPALLATIRLHWLPRNAVLLGLIAGLVAVLFTEPLGQIITGNTLPWGRWPWTIHSAGWGLFFNVLVCFIVTVSSKRDTPTASADEVRRFLSKRDKGARIGSRLRSAAWLIALVWTFFAVGPGTVLGNDLFGSPSGSIDDWKFQMPSIWAWQILWWALGVGMIWFLAYKMELVTDPDDVVTQKSESKF